MPTPPYILALREKIGHDTLLTIGTSAVIINEAGEILLQRRRDNGLWGLPGGTVEPGEQPADAAVREAYEETGVQIEPLQIIGVYGGPQLSVVFPNGDHCIYVSVLFKCRPIGGELRVDDDETMDVRYFPFDQLPENLLSIHRIRIQDAQRNEPQAIFRM